MELELTIENVKNNLPLYDLEQYVKEENLAGLICKRSESDQEEGVMGLTQFFLLRLIFGSKATEAAVNGLFETIRRWMEMREKRMETETKEREIDLKREKIVIKKINADGSKSSVTLYSFDESERAELLEILK